MIDSNAKLRSIQMPFCMVVSDTATIHQILNYFVMHHLISPLNAGVAELTAALQNLNPAVMFIRLGLAT